MAPLPPVECPFDIPSPFRWNESFKVFYQSLDDEHKGLFDAAFEVNEDRGNTGVFGKAAQKFKEHFQNEEKDLKTAVDAGSLEQSYYAGHCAAHNKFLEVYGGFSSPVTDEEINYAMKWLVNHIKTTDFQYKGKLKF